MINKVIFILILILILATGGLFYFLTTDKTNQGRNINTTYPQVSTHDFYSIHEIKQNELSFGKYNTEGYVTKIHTYSCPTCPEGAHCKPCIDDYIIISEVNKPTDNDSYSSKELILFVDNPKQFQLGKRYQFTINILDSKTTADFINNIKVIGYNPLPKDVPTGPPTIAPFTGKQSCQEMYNEIENDIKNANYCRNDADCKVLMLGGRYYKFGCYHFVNREVDNDHFDKKMDVYQKKCRKMINKCAPEPESKCVSNRCVHAS